MKERIINAKHIGFILLSLTLILCMAPSSAFAAKASYAPGEVIVLFKDGAVGESSTSLKSARAMKVTGDDFGAVLEAAGAGAEAGEAAKSEAEIIKNSLGGSFVIEDTLLFEGDGSTQTGAASDGEASVQSAEPAGDGLRIALISSDKYSTEEMIAKLSKNPDVVAAEPNAYLSFEDYDSYSIDDTYASYLYHDNAPAAVNRGGDSVSARGEDPEAAVSANAASGWKKLSGNNKEVVVAVVDTGINLENEDLVNRLWTNPGDIGLAGEHGYNFGDNDTDIMDHEGHGSHCAGLIAAEANNGKGVAGVAGEANVKIMMLKTASDTNETKLYNAMGSFNYVLKAKQRGVNVVATSNSWGRTDSQSTIFNEIVDRMGQAGILTFTAAGNSSKNLDRNTDNPASNESVYGITVGAAGINGKPAGFSNYGKTSVDVFASGVNTLSTVGYKCYFPNIYNKSKRRDTTEYFGKFTTDSKVSKNTITPYTPDDYVPVINPKGMKSFGEFEFHKQAEYGEASEDYVPSDASCEISVVKDHYFTTGSKAASLKVTIHGATVGEEYYLFFPFSKNSKTTGKNTRFSIMYQSGTVTGNRSAETFGGEVYKDSDGIYRLTGHGEHGHAVGGGNVGVDTHLSNDTEAEGEYVQDKISPYKKGEKTGIGIQIIPRTDTGWEKGETQDMVVYIDSIAVSRPGAEISLSDSYEMMSGTSMACPSAAGACALMASIYPKSDGQTYAAYAEYIRNKLFSCVRQTDELEGLCATGGYIDFRLLKSAQPVIDDAICDVDAGTLTLVGENMEPCMKLTYRRLAKKDSNPVVLPEAGMTLSYAGDGKSVVIGNAGSLFGSYLEFEMKDSSGASGKRSFFTVKGQKEPDKVLTRLKPNPEEEGYTGKEESPRMFTNADGSKIFGIDRPEGIVYGFNGKKFVPLNNGNIRESLKKLLEEQAGGNIDYDWANNISLDLGGLGDVITDGNMLYFPMSYTYADRSGTGEETTYPLVAKMDVSADDPEWTFEADDAGLGEALTEAKAIEALNGRLYFTTTGKNFSSYDLAAKTLRQEADLPEELSYVDLVAYKGNIYMLFGADWTKTAEDLLDTISDKVYRYDPNAGKWDLVSEGKVKYIGKFDSGFGRAEYQTAVTATDKGLVVVNMSIDGAGNASLFDPESDTLTPLYYTINNGLSDQPLWGSISCVTANDGVYYMRDDSNELDRGYGLWRIPASAYEGDPHVDPAPPVTPSDQGDAAAEAAFAGVSDGSVPAVKSASVRSAKKGFTVRWRKARKKQQKKFTKVEIQYCADKSFARSATVVKFAKKSSSSCKVKNLKKKATYYVRVRNVKFVNGVKYAGKWSKTKKVKTK